MTNNRFYRKIFSLISLIISGFCISTAIKINFDIAQRYSQCDGKTQALFGITETLEFYYQYYNIGLIIIAIVFAIIGTKRKENRMINGIAYFICVISLIIIFTRLWRLMI